MPVTHAVCARFNRLGNSGTTLQSNGYKMHDLDTRTTPNKRTKEISMNCDACCRALAGDVAVG